MLNIVSIVFFTGITEEDISAQFSEVSVIIYMSLIDDCPREIQYSINNGFPMDRSKF